MKIDGKQAWRVLSCAIGLALTTVPCRAGDSLTVYAEGMGASKDAATQNALRSAIEEHLGIFLSAKSLVENKVLVSQEVATYSKGIVKGYQTIEEVKEPGGYRVKLAAELLPEKIIQAFSKQPSIQISGSLDFINLQLEKERRAAALKITEQLIQRLMRDGYDIALGKTQYTPDEASAENTTRFTIPVEITTKVEAWEDALKVLRQMSPGECYRDTSICLSVMGFTKNGNPETRETIGAYPQVEALMGSFEPILLVQVRDADKKPLHISMLSLKELTTGGRYRGKFFLESPPAHARGPGSPIGGPFFSRGATFIGTTNSEAIKNFTEATAEVYAVAAANETMERLVPGSTSDSRAYPDLVTDERARPLYRVDPLGAHVVEVGDNILIRNTGDAPWNECKFAPKDAQGQLWSVPFPSTVPGHTTVILSPLEATTVSWEMMCGHCESADADADPISFEQLLCPGGKSRGLIGSITRMAALQKDKFIDGAGKPLSAKRILGTKSSSSRFPLLQSGPGTGDNGF